MRVKTLIAALALVMAVGSFAQAKGWRKVRIATEGAYAPWNATDASGKLVGFEIDLANDLCKRMTVECEFVAQDWDGIIPALQQGKYDAILAGMSITDERLQVIDFAGPYAAEPAVFATLKGSLLFTMVFPVDRVDLDAETPAGRQAIEAMKVALRGKVVGVQISTAQARLMETQWPEVRVATYDKADAAVLDLAAGRIEALLANRSAVEAINKAGAKDDELVLFGPEFTRGVLGRGVGVGVRKQDADLKAMLDKAIREAVEDGTIAELSNQHIGFDVSPHR